jgi:hypothetical protein
MAAWTALAVHELAHAIVARALGRTPATAFA